MGGRGERVRQFDVLLSRIQEAEIERIVVEERQGVAEPRERISVVSPVDVYRQLEALRTVRMNNSDAREQRKVERLS